MFWPNSKSVALTFPEIIAIEFLDFWMWVANPQCWGTGGRRGSGIAPFEGALVSFYRPSIVTFPLLRVLEILSLLCSSTPLFPHPTSSLPKFPHVPRLLGGWPLGC